MSAVPFRQYKIPNAIETQFFSSTSQANKEFAERDLAKSGLNLEDMDGWAPSMIRLPDGAKAGYGIPYYGLDGKPIVDKQGMLVMWRTRLERPEFSKERRYDQPTNEHLARYGLPGNLPYIHPKTLTFDSDLVICAEGEKKCASIIKFLGIPAFGIGGYQMWRNPDGSGTIHPWIKRICERYKNTLTIVPDGDVFRYDICNAYGTFARACESEGITVTIVNPGKKIDDLLMDWGASALEYWTSLGRIDIDSLVQSPNSLAKRYGLAFKNDTKGRITVYQHSSNVMKLMEEHHAFPEIWRNEDNNRIMVGEDTAKPDYTEMDIANYFQYNLGFDKVNHRLIYSCIQALAKKHARSPMLDWVRSQIWDGVPRLESWISKFWGTSDSAYIREISAKWLISSCARMDKPGVKIDWMFIVIGPQGVGKTSMPSILFKDNSKVLYGEQNDKDLHMILHSALCIGFDELDSFGKREASTLKAMITRSEDAFRPPYGASIEVFPRRFVLYGSGNRHEFLQSDTSGYRRYAIVEVSRLLDFSGLGSERDQLWAEAWHRYQQGGCKYWEIEGASEEAQKYVVEDPREEQILSFIDKIRTDKVGPRIHEGLIYFTMNEVLTQLGQERAGANSAMVRDVSAILRKVGAAKPEKPIRHPISKVLGKYYTMPV